MDDSICPELEQQRRHKFEEIHRIQYERVRSYVRRRAKSRDDVDDIVSEVFLTAWRRRATLPASDAEITGWLLRTAHFMLLNRHRADRRRDRLVAWLAAHTPVPVTVPEPRSILDGFDDPEIGQVFRDLRPLDQTILLLVAWDNCTIDELAAFLCCAPNAAKTRLSRARRRFREGVLQTKE
jgi:RNA polymerase sigma-70 factor (ECF subfamily)